MIASVVVLGQGCVWYSGQFWALYFLQTVKKLDVLTSSYIVGVALLIATPTLIFWGWLSDKIGRKPIILGGMAPGVAHVLPALHGARQLRRSEERQLPDVDSHRRDPGQLRGHDLRADRGVPGRVLPQRASATRRCRCRTTSATAGAAVWSRSSRPRCILSTGSVGWALVYPIAVPSIMFLIAIFVMPETRKHSIWEEGAIEATRRSA